MSAPQPALAATPRNRRRRRSSRHRRRGHRRRRETVPATLSTTCLHRTMGRRAGFYRRRSSSSSKQKARDGRRAFEVASTFSVDRCGNIRSLPDESAGAPRRARQLADQGGLRAQRWLHPLPRSSHPGENPASTGSMQELGTSCARNVTRRGVQRATMLRRTVFTEFLRIRRFVASTRPAAAVISIGREAVAESGEGQQGLRRELRRVAKKSNGFPMREPAARRRARRVRPLMKSSFARIATRDAAEIHEGWRPGQPLLDTHLPSFLPRPVRRRRPNEDEAQRSFLRTKPDVCEGRHLRRLPSSHSRQAESRPNRNMRAMSPTRALRDEAAHRP